MWVIHQISKTRALKIDDFNPIWVRLLGRSQLSNPSYLPCFSTRAENRRFESKLSKAARPVAAIKSPRFALFFYRSQWVKGLRDISSEWLFFRRPHVSSMKFSVKIAVRTHIFYKKFIWIQIKIASWLNFPVWCYWLRGLVDWKWILHHCTSILAKHHKYKTFTLMYDIW